MLEKVSKIIYLSTVAMILFPLHLSAESPSSLQFWSEETKAVHNLTLAARLERYAIEKRDPLSLVIAATIRRETPVSIVSREIDEAGPSPVPDFPAKKPRDFSSEELLETAQNFTRTSPEAVAVVEKAIEMEETQPRGAVIGASIQSVVIKPKFVNAFSIRFEGKEPAAVGVMGDGDTDLDLFIYDEDDTVICSDTAASDIAYCEWLPVRTSNFRILVENIGTQKANAFILVTN